MRTFVPSRFSVSRSNTGSAPVGSVIRAPRLDLTGLNVIDTWIFTKQSETDWARTGGQDVWWSPLNQYCTPNDNAFLEDAWSKGYKTLPANSMGRGLESHYKVIDGVVRPLTAGEKQMRSSGKVYDPYTQTWVAKGQDTKTLMTAQGKVWDPYQKAWVDKGSETIYDPTKEEQIPGSADQTALSDEEHEDMGEPPIVYALIGLGVLGIGATAAYFLFFRKHKKSASTK